MDRSARVSPRPAARTAGALLLLPALLLSQPRPGASAGHPGGLETGGSVRTIASFLQHYDNPLLFGEDNDYDGLSVTILRLTAEGSPVERWRAEVHVVQDFIASTAGEGRGAAVSPLSGGEGRYLLTDGQWTWAEEDDFRASLSLDRLNASVALGPWDLTFGRQAITFAQAWFWNPLDVFEPFDPEEFDRSYKSGVDAVKADLQLGPFSSLSLVYSPGRAQDLESGDDGLALAAVPYGDEPWEGAALLARGRANAGGWDLVLQGGKVYGGYQVGTGFSGDLLSFGLRGEAAWFLAEGDGGISLPAPQGDGEPPAVIDDHGSLVIGADRRFENSLYGALEYFWNGAGDDDNLALAAARVAAGETTNLSEHLLGLLLSYEFHPLLTGQMTWIHSLSDGSDLLSPVFTWSVADEAECLLGAIIGTGERPASSPGADPGSPAVHLRSEFGSYSNFYFLEMIFYF